MAQVLVEVEHGATTAELHEATGMRSKQLYPLLIKMNNQRLIVYGRNVPRPIPNGRKFLPAWWLARAGQDKVAAAHKRVHRWDRLRRYS